MDGTVRVRVRVRGCPFAPNSSLEIYFIFCIFGVFVCLFFSPASLELDTTCFAGGWPECVGKSRAENIISSSALFEINNTKRGVELMFCWLLCRHWGLLLFFLWLLVSFFSDWGRHKLQPAEVGTWAPRSPHYPRCDPVNSSYLWR